MIAEWIKRFLLWPFPKPPKSGQFMIIGREALTLCPNDIISVNDQIYAVDLIEGYDTNPNLFKVWVKPNPGFEVFERRNQMTAVEQHAAEIGVTAEELIMEAGRIINENCRTNPGMTCGEVVRQAKNNLSNKENDE